MDGRKGGIACAIAMALAGCVTAAPVDVAHHGVVLPWPYAHLPADAPIEAGVPVGLDPLQQEAVVVGVSQWMKEPSSATFGTMRGARNTRGIVTICGLVAGRTSAGATAALAPFIGVMLGTPGDPEFVVVGIGSLPRSRAEVLSLCRESGVAQIE
ncbi:hypothetical protein [Reyranella sp.]|uniref:hypothetical protein n=1 Tax=Reyranella sp. TaxID=1929291 RepID=UPI003BAAF8C5